VLYRMTTDTSCLIAIKKAFPVWKFGGVHLKSDRAQERRQIDSRRLSLFVRNDKCAEI